MIASSQRNLQLRFSLRYQSPGPNCDGGLKTLLSPGSLGNEMWLVTAWASSRLRINERTEANIPTTPLLGMRSEIEIEVVSLTDFNRPRLGSPWTDLPLGPRFPQEAFHAVYRSLL